MLERFKKWMQGRYGADQLSIALLVSWLILTLLTGFLPIGLFRLLPLILLVLCYWRIFSKNIYKRQQENFKFIRWWQPIQKQLNTQLTRIKQWRTHKYFKCPKCKQTLRVPRGKGKICITCPKCKTQLHKHS